jgi:hypothetical protein
MVGLAKRIGRRLVLVIPRPPSAKHPVPDDPGLPTDAMPVDETDTALT